LSSHICLGFSKGVPPSEFSNQHFARIYLYFAPHTLHTPKITLTPRYVEKKQDPD
jgi:hypothetical protein